MPSSIAPHLLQNAIVSIQLGVEDYKSNDPRRAISAIRNFYAGVLLLGKQCLLDQAPASSPMEILATSLVPVLDKNGSIKHVPKGQRTIDLEELRERFKHFGLEWPKGDIKTLRRLRNEFEHFHSLAQDITIRQVIASCFPLVDGFFEILGLNAAQQLGPAWEIMLEEEAFFAMQKKACYATLAALSWHDELKDVELSCPSCGSALLFQVNADNDDPTSIEGKCKACDVALSAEQFVDAVVEAIQGIDDFMSVKDGGESIVHDCPDCGQSAYVQTGELDRCYFCERVRTLRKPDGCQRCLGEFTFAVHLLLSHEFEGRLGY